ncbi:MAG: hypothetical protein ACI86H_002821, partial [bacterium]
EYKGNIDENLILGTMTAYKPITGEEIKNSRGTWVATLKNTIKPSKEDTPNKNKTSSCDLFNIENALSNK